MLKIGSIVWGVKDIQKEADFWTAALNYEVTYQSIDFAILKPKKGNEGVLRGGIIWTFSATIKKKRSNGCWL